jgi:sRNA-binding carbon storage regulator CsrA
MSKTNNRGNLELRRKEGQRIIIGTPPQHAVVTVSKISGKNATLIVNAPKTTVVDREEIALQRSGSTELI